ncbi:acetyl-CoA carboxylase biotin carboxyl carrier protein [Vampirovibrio sp.]|uniref:acetyl-CoA carboxylase biotin carboxyl carrier protein n=1 Tax=Vampirovibrio sp. TaxID=2717857 RepID=UPI003593A994
MDINTEKIRELADLALEKKLAELIVSDGDKSVTIKLPGYNIQPMLHQSPGHQPMVYTPAAPAPVAEIPAVSSHTVNAESAKAASLEDKYSKVTSPMVGTFYSAPSPDSPDFVSVGQNISKGQTVCIIEAMKMMNELESEVSGKVVRILVENGQPVEFGQAIMLVEPA